MWSFSWRFQKWCLKKFNHLVKTYSFAPYMTWTVNPAVLQHISAGIRRSALIPAGLKKGLTITFESSIFVLTVFGLPVIMNPMIWSPNSLNFFPCKCLVNYSVSISLVLQCSIITSPNSTLSLMKNYHKLMCLVSFVLDTILVLSKIIMLMLSWYNVDVLTSNPWHSRK